VIHVFNKARRNIVANEGLLYSFIRFLCFPYWDYKNRDRVVGIATGYGLDDREVGVRVPVM
jgi:hypothetical protein